MKVNLTAPISEPTGYGEFSRHVAAGLIEAGADVKIRPLNFDSRKAAGVGAEFASLLGTHTKPDVALICMIPPKFKELRDPKVKTAAFTMFEAERLPDGWAQACEAVNEVFTPSVHSFEQFVKSGVKHTSLVAPPIRFPDLHVKEPSSPYSFYSIFQWTERKNPIGLIRAYWAAFSGNNDVVLRLKLYLKDQDQTEFQRIQSEIATLKRQARMPHHPRIELETSHMSEAQIVDFHKTNDCFVSASRGEGLGLGAITAMGMGKLCILSWNSGHMDFVPDCEHVGSEQITARVVHCSRWPTMSTGTYAPFYDGTNFWAEPDLGELVRQMQLAYEHRNLRTGAYPDPVAIGKTGASKVREIYDFKTNSAVLMRKLKQVAGA